MDLFPSSITSKVAPAAIPRYSAGHLRICPSASQGATLTFAHKLPESVVQEVARLPGVLAAEPLRTVPVRIRNGSVKRRVTIRGLRPHAELSRILDAGRRPVVLPDSGLAVSDLLGRILGVRAGDLMEIDLLEGQKRTLQVPISLRSTSARLTIAIC